MIMKNIFTTPNWKRIFKKDDWKVISQSQTKTGKKIQRVFIPWIWWRISNKQF